MSVCLSLRARLPKGAANLNITRETKVSSGRDARRMLGAGGKSQILTAEELKQCQKYAKVDLLRALRERARADNNLRTFERSFYKKIKSAKGPEAFNYEVRCVMVATSLAWSPSPYCCIEFYSAESPLSKSYS